MSNNYYNELWRTTYNDVENLQTLDNSIQANKTSKSREIALTQILPIYLRYRNIIKRLIQCYDQIIHSQKRQFIKRLLDCSIGRMLEYRREIVKLNCSEYEWPDDLLIRMKWTPDDIAISPPSSYVSDRQEQLEQRRKLIDNLIEQAELANREVDNKSINQTPLISAVDLDPTSSKLKIRRRVKIVQPSSQLSGVISNAQEFIDETDEERFRNAILTIQIHERARAGRVIATETEVNYNYNMKLKTGEIELKQENMTKKNKAAVTIQRHWKGYAARKRFIKYFDKMDEVLGMKLCRVRDKSVMKKDEENTRRRKELQAQARLRTEDTTSREKTRIFDTRGPTLKEDITDEIHEWFNLWYNSLGHFGIFPTPKAGGTILVATGQSLTPEEYSAQKRESKKKKKGKKKEKKPKKKEKKKKNKDEGWIMPESKILQNVLDIKREYKEIWSLRNELNDLNQGEHMDLIQNEIYYELQLNIREIVDELMRLELDRLNKALRKDHKHDKRKFKFPGMKKKKKRKRRKRKKKGKPTVPQDKIDEMFNELVLARIIKNYPSVKLNEWIGDLSYQNYEAKKNFQPHQHRLGEVKQTVIDYCILPLGTKEIHTLAPLIKSVCIVGLPRTGKSFLANAICNEIGALLFDLTPSNLVGKYDGKVNGKKLMKMIGILARHYPPAIVMIDGGEKPWWKKVPLEEQPTRPRRLAKLLPKFIKSIKRGDQILVLGLASEPWKSKKRFYKVYNKFITIPSTDYNTLYLFYQNILMNYHGVDRNFDVSSLTKATVGYPLDVIREAIENVLNIKRRIMLKIQPLLPEEILTELIKWTSPKDKVKRQLEIFENKTPLVNHNNINEVITNFYEALVLVRYPGIAQIDLSNLECTVLAENNRNSLLHWLLVQSINVVDSTLDIPTADETSLIKWYSQFGVCTNKNALLGQCPLPEQLDTLVNLTKFIMNVLGADGNEAPVRPDSDRDILQKYVDSEINIFPPLCDLPICNLTYRETRQYITAKNQALKDQDNNIHNGSNINEAPNIPVSENTEVDSDVKMDKQTTNSAILEEFCEAFRSVDICNNSECSRSEEDIKSVEKCIENIHAKFSTFNEALRSRTEISNIVIPAELNIEESPLNQVIQETVISLENLAKLHGTDDGGTWSKFD